MDTRDAASPAGVRVPAWLSGYACRRTLVCCHAPWRPSVLAGEQHSVTQTLTLRGTVGAMNAARQWSGAVVRRAGLDVLRQVDERCVLLDAADPACTLHREAGLEAMPEACRSFPRSIAQTPHGVEVAFALGCPTATTLVIEGRGGFRFAAVDAALFAYRASLRVGDRVAWSHATDIAFSELVSLREAWWARLAKVDHGEALARVAAAMLQDPAAPQGDGGVGDGPSRLDANQLQRITTSLTRLPSRGQRYAECLRPLWVSLREPASNVRLASVSDETAKALARSLALGVQAAGVHVPGLANETLRFAAAHVAEVAMVSEALANSAGVTELEALQDALVACT